MAASVTSFNDLDRARWTNFKQGKSTNAGTDDEGNPIMVHGPAHIILFAHPDEHYHVGVVGPAREHREDEEVLTEMLNVMKGLSDNTHGLSMEEQGIKFGRKKITHKMPIGYCVHENKVLCVSFKDDYIKLPITAKTQLNTLHARNLDGIVSDWRPHGHLIVTEAGDMTYESCKPQIDALTGFKNKIEI